jgi:Transposase, Mutator family
MRNALAHAGKSGRRVVSAFIATAFAQDDTEAARLQWRKVADQLRPSIPKLAKLMNEAEVDVLAFMGFPASHRAKLHSINPIERLNGEIKRRTEVVGIFPNEAAIRRLVGAILLEQNDEWAVQRARYRKPSRLSAKIPSSGCPPWQPKPGPGRRSWWPSRSYTTPRDTIHWAQRCSSKSLSVSGCIRTRSGERCPGSSVETLCFLLKILERGAHKAANWHWPAEEIALCMRATLFRQCGKLQMRFDALGDDFEIEATAKGNDGLNDCAGLAAFQHIRNEGTVDFYLVERELPEIT